MHRCTPQMLKAVVCAEVEEEVEEDGPFDGKDISAKDIYKVGVICKVVKKLKLPDGSVNILVHEKTKIEYARYKYWHVQLHTPNFVKGIINKHLCRIIKN